MNKTRTRWAPLVAASLLCTFIAGCSGGDNSANVPTIANDRSGVLSESSTSSAWYFTVVEGDAPLVYYRLNDYSGSTFADSSGAYHSAAANGTVAFRQGRLLPGSASSNSAIFTNGYATESITSTVNALTVEAWIRPVLSDLGSGYYAPRLVENAWADHSGNGYMLWIDGGYARFNVGYHELSSQVPLVAGQIYHLVGTFDPSSTPNTMKLYVNGALVNAIDPNWALPKANVGDSAVTYIGALDAAPGGPGIVDHFEGNLAEVAIYNHALTAQQVGVHYQTGAVGPISAAPGAVVSSPTSLTFTSAGANAVQTLSVSQSNGSGTFTAAASGGDPSSVSIAVSGSTVSVNALHAGTTNVVISGAGGMSLTVPVAITTTSVTLQ